MFNSVTKYLWGSSSDHEQDYTDKNSLEHGSGEQLETQQDEDWVVVQAAGENIQSSLLEEGEGDSTEPQNEGASDQGQAAVTVTQPRHRAAQAAPHPTFISPHQITQTTQYAQRALCKKGKKHINNRKCKMQNKVREARRNTGSVNHKNKRMQPSGCRASRFNQRM